MKRQASEFPLFWNFSTDPEKQAACQAKLMQFYFENFGEKLDVPKYPEHIKPAPVIDEGKSELERMMRQAPKHQKRIPNL